MVEGVLARFRHDDSGSHTLRGRIPDPVQDQPCFRGLANSIRGIDTLRAKRLCIHASNVWRVTAGGDGHIGCSGKFHDKYASRLLIILTPINILRPSPSRHDSPKLSGPHS